MMFNPRQDGHFSGALKNWIAIIKNRRIKMKKNRSLNKPQGESKYALKCKRRLALARKLGVPVAPLPVLYSTTSVEIPDDFATVIPEDMKIEAIG